MPVYNYKGFDESGRETKGIIDAESPKAARTKLRKTGVFTTDIVDDAATGLTLSGDLNLTAVLRRVSVDDIAMSTRQLATLLAAGIPMVESLLALADQCENPKLKKILTGVRERVTGGAGLADALAEHPKTFGDLYINMVRAGESSGAMDLVLTRLADFLESQAKLQSRVTGALVYPLILLCVSIAVLLVIFTRVIPKIAAIFAQQKVQLPLLTRIFIGISKALVTYWWIALIFLIIVALFINRYRRTVKGRLFFDRLSLHLPVFGKLFRMVAVSRFAKTLATLLKGGVPMLRSIEIVGAVVTNRIFSEVIVQTRDYVKEGQSLAEPLRRSGVFPPMVTHMIAIGEKTGALENMLERVADTYDQQVNAQVNVLTSLLEPILILFMGGIVFTIVMAVLMPMLQMSQLGR